MEYNTPNTTQVILVDTNDHPLGITDKLEAHRQGLLHRAILVFIFNHKGEWHFYKGARLSNITLEDYGPIRAVRMLIREKFHWKQHSGN